MALISSHYLVNLLYTDPTQNFDFIAFSGHLAKMHINKQTTQSESDKLWLELFKLVSEGNNPMEKHAICREKAMWLSENVVKGEKKWNQLRKCIGEDLIPAFNQIKLFKKDYHPTLGKQFISFNQCHQLYLFGQKCKLQSNIFAKWNVR